MTGPSPEKVTLVHDWLTGMRGGERVLELLCAEFPDAPVYTLLSKPSAVSDSIRKHPIQTSFLQNVPGIQSRYRYGLPLFPRAINSLPLVQGDMAISTSHCVAKSIRTSDATKSLCYCFTPMRYAWTFYEEYFGTNPLKKLILSPILSSLRRWDKATASRVDHFVAISHHVQTRIKDFYDRESAMVYPPVDTDRNTPSGDGPGDYDLIVSALVPYKRIDLAVKAYAGLDRKLKIVGIGGDAERLKQNAGSHIEFLGWQSDEKVVELYQNCRMLIFPGEEDFGIVPLEAQACGRPVVAYGRGGALETIQDGRTGVFFHEQNATALKEAVRNCAGRSWSPEDIRSHAETFGNERFLENIRREISACFTGNGS